MISEKILTKVIQNDLLGVVVEYVVAQFLQKKLWCCDKNLMLVAYNKTNIQFSVFLFGMVVVTNSVTGILFSVFLL